MDTNETMYKWQYTSKICSLENCKHLWYKNKSNPSDLKTFLDLQYLLLNVLYCIS